MAHPSLLLLSVFIGALTKAHSQRLTPLVDSFKIVTDVVIPCGSRCVVQNYREVLQTTDNCILSSTGLYPTVERYLRANNLLETSGNVPTYQQIYDVMFSEGRSPLCAWYRMYGPCLTNGFGQNCGTGIQQALMDIFQNFDPFICSNNPNYIACMMHPSLFGDLNSQQNNGPYATCAITLANNFMNIDYQNYYNNVILRNNGDFLFNNLRTFSNCIGDAVSAVAGPTGCSIAGQDIKQYISDALNNFHFGMVNGKDYLKCFAKPALHMNLTECGQTFESDLRTLYGDSFLTVLNTTLLNGQYSGLQQPYTRLRGCFKTAMNANCGNEQDSVALVTRMLHPLDHLFGVRSDSPSFCAPNPITTPQPPARRLAPMEDSFEVLTEVLIPCGSRCVVQKYREILQASNMCVMSNSGLQMEVQRYIETSNLGNNPSWDQIYKAFFSEGISPLCRWWRRYGGCSENQFGRICGSGVQQAITGLLQDLEAMVCSQTPNYLACITHPSLINGPPQSFTSPYGRCMEEVMTAFSNVNNNNYYQALMLNGQGQLLFNTIRTFGKCIGDAIKTVQVSPPTGCEVVGNEVKKYINDAVDYFDFGQGGKDYVKCFSRGALHMALTDCGERFVSALQMKFDDMTLTRLNETLYNGGYRALQQPYIGLSACINMAMVNHCGQDRDSSNLVSRILHPLDHLYGLRRDEPRYCEGSSSAALTSVANLGLLLSGLLLLLGILRFN